MLPLVIRKRPFILTTDYLGYFLDRTPHSGGNAVRCPYDISLGLDLVGKLRIKSWAITPSIEVLSDSDPLFMKLLIQIYRRYH